MWSIRHDNIALTVKTLYGAIIMPLSVSVWDGRNIAILFAAVDTFVTNAIGESMVIIPDADACFTFWTVFVIP